MREAYEVRVREKINGKSVVKSKFYGASRPSDARGKYKGKGTIVSVTKIGKEKIFGIGEFFVLGDILLKELQRESTPAEIIRNKEKEKRVENRKFLSRRKRLAAY